MVEGLIVLIGLCIAFIPVIMYVKYLFNHIKQKTRFDYHLELVKDKKGNLGVYIAYLERIFFGTFIGLLGILMSEFFRNETIFISFVIVLVIYIIIKYFDEKNEK